MKTLLKIYSASCFVVVAFILFFAWVPFDPLPFSPAVISMTFGGGALAATSAYYFSVRRREGFEFGWFLANKGGFWVVAIACFAALVFLSGLLLYIAPETFEPAFERGSWPVAGMLVILFWFSLIFMFGFLSFMQIGQATGFVRLRYIKRALGAFALAAICLLMTALFFSLFLEVINDVFFRISVPTQWKAIWIFTGLLLISGIVRGGLVDRIDILNSVENDANTRTNDEH
ncbi:MAG: hypothetical protein ACRD6X_00820 [Pyrinomonadaceae bacterium]